MHETQAQNEPRTVNIPASAASRIILALAVAEAVALGVIYWMWLL